jgi:hypothetical protein
MSCAPRPFEQTPVAQPLLPSGAAIQDRKTVNSVRRPGTNYPCAGSVQSKSRSCSTIQVKEHLKMRNRRHTLLWMKDLIEHMSRCHDQLEMTNDGETQSFLADSLIGDLNECQKLCEQLRSGHSRQSRSTALAAS